MVLACDPGKYNCTNGICIDQALEFNGVNNCGDNSDEGKLN